MREPDDLIGFGPVETPADKWRNAFIGLLFLVILTLLAAHFGWGS